MAPTVRVKAFDLVVRKQREELAWLVLDQFGDSFRDCRLLCFFDDEDCREFKLILGEHNRGFHRSINDRAAFVGWPSYVTDCIFDVEASSLWHRRIFDHVVYLHGSTCNSDVGMTMTFAHELQHVIQGIKVPELLAANRLFRLLPKSVLQEEKLQWSDIPTEREARATSKKVAVRLHGDEAVGRFLVQRALTTYDPIELADVRFIRGLDTSIPYLLKKETLALFERFRKYRPEFESVLKEFKSDPDFEAIELNSLMPSVSI